MYAQEAVRLCGEPLLQVVQAEASCLLDAALQLVHAVQSCTTVLAWHNHAMYSSPGHSIPTPESRRHATGTMKSQKRGLLAPGHLDQACCTHISLVIAHDMETLPSADVPHPDGCIPAACRAGCLV